MNTLHRWLTVVLFAAAMAWVESAVVLYLRVLIGRLDPYQTNPLPVSVSLGTAELVREAATLVMLFAVGLLAGRTPRGRVGYALLAFGVWDLLYYVFLVPLTGWPHTLWDWDILFLLPVPWWGPVLAPASIATLMLLLGTFIVTGETQTPPRWPRGRAWLLSLAGVILALYTFMAGSLAALSHGIEAVRTRLPTAFAWPIFLAALLLLSAPLLEMAHQWWNRNRKPTQCGD